MKKIVGIILIAMLCLALFGITSRIVPVAFSDEHNDYREVWKLLNVTVPGTMDVDVDITVSPKNGVYIACSPNITQYFVEKPTGYGDWMEWLNRSTADHHWEGMDWLVSDGSLTPITYDDIQQWGIMYMDTGNVPYWTFRGNTYMADSNLTQYSSEDDPDIISTAIWDGNTIKIIDDLPIDASIRTKVNVVFKIVLTEPGVYTFNIAAPADVELSETSWVIGGVKTLTVPGDYLTIQEAVDAADSGYTIIVHDGTYNENVVLPQGKSLTLLGAQANIDPRGGREGPETILDGGGYSSGNYGFTIHDTVGEDVVTINGFTIKNYEYGIFGHYDDDAFVQNLTVSYNILENNGDPALPSDNWHHGGGAIRIDNVDYSTFSHNVITECERGIRLDDNSKGGSDYNIVEYNLIHDLQQYGIGLYDYANNNTVTNNTIYNCADRGIQLWKANMGNKILNNTIYNCCNDGILLHNSVNAEIKHNDVYNCAFTNQTWSGYSALNDGPTSGFGYQPVHAGIAILGASFNITITGNNVHENGALYREMPLTTKFNGTAAWMTGTNHLGALTQDIINLTAVWNNGAHADEASVHILPQPGMTLDDFQNMSWMVNTTNGYPPHVDLSLDTDGDGRMDEMLTAEFAYQAYDGGPGYAFISAAVPPTPPRPYSHYDPAWQANCYFPDYNKWRRTFEAPDAHSWNPPNTATGSVAQVDDKTIFWSSKGIPGPYAGGYFATLAGWKAGGVTPIGGGAASAIDGSAVITDIQIEVDGWLRPTEAHVDEIKLNGVSLRPWSDWNGLTRYAASDGIWIDSESSAVIFYNNIYKNGEYGVENANTSIILESAFNWWGDEKGPGNETGSTGDYVSDNVDYEPWLIKPYAPGQVVPVAVVYVDPEFVNLTAPALGADFTVDVSIANVTMMYGFQFTMEWDSTLLNLTIANPHVPTPWLGVECWINQTQTASDYSLAMAPFEAGAPTFTGSASLVSLNFQTIKDPIYSYEPKVTCSLALKDVKLVNASTYIPCIAFSGNYSCYPTMPKLLVIPSNPKARKVPTEFAVNITVTDVVNLYSYEFNLTYNQTLLYVTDVISPPYNLSKWQEDRSSGEISVRVEGLSPTINGTKTLATIKFKVRQGFAWSTQTTSVNCTLAFTSHTLNLTDGTPIKHEAENGKYSYVPLKGDVHYTDGLVDIYDLLFVANKFGTKPGVESHDDADLNCDGEIDILDIILVARNFGAEV